MTWSGLPVYVDGADEIDGQGCMIKGGGGALTREKIVADLAERFICIVDEYKCVQTLGSFALPVEVIPMAAAQVARRLTGLGARAVPRAGFVTDNGGLILDAHGLVIDDPLALERRDQPMAGRRDRGHLRAAPRQPVPAGHRARREDLAFLNRAAEKKRVPFAL